MKVRGCQTSGGFEGQEKSFEFDKKDYDICSFQLIEDHSYRCNLDHLKGFSSAS